MSELARTELSRGPGIMRPGREKRMSGYLFEKIGERLNYGAMTAELPGGARVSAAGAQAGPTAHLQVHDTRMARRVTLGGALGLADSYIDGDWDSDDLTSVIELGARNLDALSVDALPNAVARVISHLRHRRRANTRRGSRRNIMAHYDLGNDFYARWLDRDMVYSSAIFERPDEPLITAQQRKFDRLARRIDLQPGDRLLEIGCGWGGFAIHAAAHFGVRATALTLSPAQAAWARARVRAAGLDDRIEIRLQDYRDVEGQFDKIASIEMFEAVGEKYWPVFFTALRDRLRPGGKAGLQVISIDDSRFPAYRRNPDFIQLRVFPGGMLPSRRRFEACLEKSGLMLTQGDMFGGDYAETLRRWRDSFEAAWPEIAAQGFGTRFRRLWRYYLSYCEAGFRSGHISVGQYVIQHAPNATRSSG